MFSGSATGLLPRKSTPGTLCSSSFLARRLVMLPRVLNALVLDDWVLHGGGALGGADTLRVLVEDTVDILCSPERYKSMRIVIDYTQNCVPS